jgi:hypothetical protein
VPFLDSSAIPLGLPFLSLLPKPLPCKDLSEALLQGF